MSVVATSRDLDVDGVAWVLALVLFGVGDVTTTVVGFSLGATEANPVLAAVGPTVPLMIGAKAAVFGVAFLVYRWSPTSTWATPAALATLGAGIVGWNLAVLGVLLAV